jgi:hypothetical protein
VWSGAFSVESGEPSPKVHRNRVSPALASGVNVSDIPAGPTHRTAGVPASAVPGSAPAIGWGSNDEHPVAENSSASGEPGLLSGSGRTSKVGASVAASVAADSVASPHAICPTAIATATAIAVAVAARGSPEVDDAGGE